MIVTAATPGVPVNLLSAVATDETKSRPLAIPSSFKQHKVSITGSVGVASGAVTIESALEADYAGDWNPITSAITVVADDVIEYNFSGIYSFIRARVSTAIGSGTVDVDYVGS